jgi:hypothetical protein
VVGWRDDKGRGLPVWTFEGRVDGMDEEERFLEEIDWLALDQESVLESGERANDLKKNTKYLLSA